MVNMFSFKQQSNQSRRNFRKFGNDLDPLPTLVKNWWYWVEIIRMALDARHQYEIKLIWWTNCNEKADAWITLVKVISSNVNWQNGRNRTTKITTAAIFFKHWQPNCNLFFVTFSNSSYECKQWKVECFSFAIWVHFLK